MITVIGATNIDIIAATSAAFVPHDSNPSHITMGIGGVGKNYAHNLVLLGEHIQFISLFGDDYLGDVARKECKRLGFDTHLSDTPKGARSSMFLCINNTVGQMQAGAADVEIIEQYLTPEFLVPRMGQINNSQLVLFDANLPVEAMIYLLENCTAPMMADTVSRKKASRITDALAQAHNPHLHTLKLNHIEAQYILGEELGKDLPKLCKALHELGVSNIYITLGSEGVFCSGTPFQLELVEPTQVSFCTTKANRGHQRRRRRIPLRRGLRFPARRGLPYNRQIRTASFTRNYRGAVRCQPKPQRGTWNTL